MPVSHQTFHQPPVLEWVNESATVEFGTCGCLLLCHTNQSETNRTNRRKWNNTFQSNWVNWQKWFLHFLFPSPIPHINEIYWREEGHLVNVKMKQQISVQPVRLITVWRWSQTFQLDHTKTDLSIWLLTKISRLFVKMESTTYSTVYILCSLNYMYTVHVHVTTCHVTPCQLHEHNRELADHQSIEATQGLA